MHFGQREPLFRRARPCRVGRWRRRDAQLSTGGTGAQQRLPLPRPIGRNRAQEPRQFEPKEFVAQGDKVVALGHYAWHVRSTGREWESDFAHVFTVEDGKVRRFQEYTDSAALAEAFREG